MKVAKWGNSLAVRLPSALVEALGVTEGDEIELTVKAERKLEVSAEDTIQKRLERIRALQVPMPPGYKFNREELYDREDREARYLEDDIDSKDPGAAAD